MKNSIETKLPEVRREISIYMNKHRLVKVTMFKQGKYFGTLILSKKYKKFPVYGYSRLNDEDKMIDKSIGSLFATYRYLNSLRPWEYTLETSRLLDLIKSVIPVKYRKYVKYPLLSDKYVDIIRSHIDNLVPGYNKVNFQVDIVKYESMSINGLEAQISSQNLTSKYYEV